MNKWFNNRDSDLIRWEIKQSCITFINKTSEIINILNSINILYWPLLFWLTDL